MTSMAFFALAFAAPFVVLRIWFRTGERGSARSPCQGHNLAFRGGRHVFASIVLVCLFSTWTAGTATAGLEKNQTPCAHAEAGSSDRQLSWRYDRLSAGTTSRFPGEPYSYDESLRSTTHLKFVATETGGDAKPESPTVSDALKDKKGSITNAPLPEGSPGWDEIRGKTLHEINAGAKAGKPGYKTIKKLLTDKRFNK